MIDSLIELFLETGFWYVDWRMIVMWMVVLVLFYLAVYKEFEPLLLVPIAFGALLANLPSEGVVMAKVKDKINPLIGSAGVSAVPMAERVSQIEGQKADP